MANLVVRGRAAHSALTEAERLRFDHFQLVILNIVEAHLFQVDRTAGKVEKQYRQWAVENMRAVVRAYFSHPGTRAFWSNNEAFFEPRIRTFVTQSLEKSAPAAEGALA